MMSSLVDRSRVSVGLSEGGRLSAIIVELDGRVLLTELDWLHRMAPHLFIRVLPIEVGWVYVPPAQARELARHAVRVCWNIGKDPW